MKQAEPKPDIYPIEVEDSKLFQMGSTLRAVGYGWLVVGVDDQINTVFVRPTAKRRRERRDAVRKMFK